MRFPWPALLLIATAPAAAQDRAPVNITRIDDAAGPTVVTRDCVPLQAHQASDDVTYRPGVDVNGKPVVPADLAQGSQASAGVPAEIGIDLKRAAGARVGAAQGNSDILVGLVAIDPLTGKAKLNGVDLAPQAGAVVGYSCR